MTDYKLEVDKLTKEIKQLKADKDFVWTLWKRLQLSTPDVADAMNLVAQREKEKNASLLTEFKEEIQLKDDRIKELSRIVREKEKEIDSLARSKEEYVKRSLQLENQCSDLTEKASKLDRLLSKTDERNQREVVTAYEQERKELLNTISRLQSQITLLRDEKNHLKLENVEQQEKIKNLEFLKDSISLLRVQIDEANLHMTTQEETIQLLREQLEQNLEFEKTYGTEDGYSSDRTEEYRSTRRRTESVTGSHAVVEEERPVTPIEDLNYKVDRLTMHMRHLQQCVATKDQSQMKFTSRPRSTPPRRPLRNDIHKDDTRKIQYLTQKLSKTEAMLSEETKNCGAANDILKKTNSRVQSMQLTIKQLRKQIEDNRMVESEWKTVIARLENDLERTQNEIRNKEFDISRLHQNASSDAARIQDLLSLLESTRYELSDKKITSQQENDGEVERLKELTRQLETEKSNLEMKLSYLQSELDNTKSMLQRNESNYVKAAKAGSNVVKNRRVKILSKKTRRLASRKSKSMQSILNHFAGGAGDYGDESSNKNDEWEDQDMDVEEEEEEDDRGIVHTDRTSASSQVSKTSIGTKIAKTSAGNHRLQSNDRNKSRQALAKQYHIYRINEARDASQERESVDAACCQCRTLKNRVSSLQQQLKAVTISRDGCKSKLRHYVRQMKICHTDLAQAKARCERLVDSIKKQCGRIEILMEERRQLLGNSEPPQSQEYMWKEFGMDHSDVASIAKAHLDEITSHVTMVRELHQELSQRDVQVVQLREKFDRSERENTCKKRIIEDLRSKLQCLDGLKERERNIVDSKEKKCRDLEESVFRLKTQLESLQTRFNVVLNDRRKFEFEANNLSTKLDIADKKNLEIRQAKQILEIQLNKVDQEKDGKMVEIISRSDSALDRLSQQIQCYKMRCSKYENLVVNLARTLADKSREIRRLIEFGHSTFRKFDSDRKTLEPIAPGYDFARSKAADILSLSASEIDSLMNGDLRPTVNSRDKFRRQKNNSSVDSRNDLSGKCKLCFKKDSFDEDIQSLFAEELERIVEFVAPMSSDSGCISSS